MRGYLNFVNEFYWPLSISRARKRLAEEGLKLRKAGEVYSILGSTGKAVAEHMCFDQVVRYIHGYRDGYSD
jgi:hypothetical protein